MHRISLPPPRPRRPITAKVLNALCAVGLGIALALLLFHWASCEGVC